MQVLQNVGAVVAGYFTMVVLVMSGTMLWVAAMVPGGIKAMKGNPTMTPTPTYLAVNLVLSLIAAMVGALVTSLVAGRDAAGPIIGLAALLLVMSVVSVFTTKGGSQPSWYKFVIPLVGLAGIAATWMLRP